MPASKQYLPAEWHGAVLAISTDVAGGSHVIVENHTADDVLWQTEQRRRESITRERRGYGIGPKRR
jgi:hypothetical protein